ncbi:hypothetical protein ACWDTR_03055 [Streptomyces sp. NPDC003470]|uniref:hypothetical protein n=1 Tax=Streptomyces sp. NPDC127100 TaxID=3347138 RepID=UPI00365883B5
MNIRETVARLFGRAGSGVEENSTVNMDSSARPSPHRSDGNRVRRRIRIGKVFGGVVMLVALARGAAGLLIAVEDIHDRGGLCAFDTITENNFFNSILCESRGDASAAGKV